MDILTYIKRMNQIYGNDTQVAGLGVTVLPEDFDELSPQEEKYYQQGPFSTREDFLAAKGGRIYDTKKYLQGGRVGYQEAGVVARKSPIKINEETFKKIDNFIAKSEGTLSKKALGESLGYKIVEKGKTAGQGGLNKVIKAWEESRGKTFEFKPATMVGTKKATQILNLYDQQLATLPEANFSEIARAIYGKDDADTRKIVRSLVKRERGFKRSPNLKYEGPLSESQRKSLARRTKLKSVTNPEVEKLLRAPKDSGLNLHHMESKRWNVTMGNLAYVDASLNQNELMKAEGVLEGFYKQRDKLADDAIEAHKAINKKGSDFVKQKKFKGLLNFKTYDPTSKKLSDVGVDLSKAIIPKGQFEEFRNIPLKELTKEQKNRVIEIAQKSRNALVKGDLGMLGEGFSKFAKKMPKTAGALGKTGRFLFHPVEMGALPLFLAAEGLYANYADKRDLKKALDQMDIPQEQKDALLEGFRQESRDLGGVGLETYAIEQPNVQEKLEEIGYGDRTELLKDARAPIADIREQDALAKQLKKQEIEKRRKEAYEDAIGRGSKRPIDFKKGGRVSFKLGGIDKGRRAILKLLAALGIGTATVGTGLIKLGGKAVGKKAAVKTGVDIATSTPGMPSWFPALVNKIVKEGDDVTSKLATQERQVVHTKKIDTGSTSPDDVTVYRDLDTGDIRVEVDSASNMGEAPIQMDYKAPSVIDEGKMKGKKTKSEFSAVESEPRVANPDGDMEFDGENIVGNVDELFSDTTKLKNYATGKKPTMKDIVTTKKKTDMVEEIHKNPGEYITNKYGDGPDLDYDDYLPDIDDID